MKTLNSNAVKSKGQEWYGLDASQIFYPNVASSVTVTCIVKGGLAGLHLASRCAKLDRSCSTTPKECVR